MELEYVRKVLSELETAMNLIKTLRTDIVKEGIILSMSQQLEVLDAFNSWLTQYHVLMASVLDEPVVIDGD